MHNDIVVTRGWVMQHRADATGKICSQWCRLVLSSLLLAWSCAVACQLSAEDLVADTQCELVFDLPEDSVVKVAGRSYEDPHKVKLTKLTAEKRSVFSLEIKFPSGAVQRKSLFVRGGERVRIAARDPVQSGVEVVVQAETAGVDFVRYGPNNRYLFVDGDIWDAESGMLIRNLESMANATFHPDGELIAVQSYQSPGVRIYSLRDGSVVRTFRPPSDSSADSDQGQESAEPDDHWGRINPACPGANAVGFSPDGDYLSIIYSLGQGDDVQGDGVHVYRLADAKLVLETSGATFDFSRDSKYVAIAGRDTTKICRLRDGRIVSRTKASVKGQVACSPSNDYYVTCVAAQGTEKYLADYKRIQKEVDSLESSWGDLGERFKKENPGLSWDHPKRVKLFDDHLAEINGFRDTLNRLPVQLQIRSLPDGELLKTLSLESSAWCQFSPKGSFLIGRSGGEMQCWVTDDWSQKWTTSRSDAASMMEVQISPDESSIVGMDCSQILSVFDMNNGKHMHRLPDAESQSCRFGVSFSISQDSKYVATGPATIEGERGVSVWNLQNGKRERRIGGRLRGVRSLALQTMPHVSWSLYSGDDVSQKIGSRSSRHTENSSSPVFILPNAIRFPITSEKPRPLQPETEVWVLGFDVTILDSGLVEVSGKAAFGGSNEDEVKYTLPRLSPKMEAIVSPPMNQMQFGVSSKRSAIVCQGNDQQLHFWDLEKRTNFFSFKGHNRPLVGLSADSDFQMSILAYDDNLVQVIDLSKGEMLCEFQAEDAIAQTMLHQSHGLIKTVDSFVTVFDLHSGVIEHRNRLQGKNPWLDPVNDESRFIRTNQLSQHSYEIGQSKTDRPCLWDESDNETKFVMRLGETNVEVDAFVFNKAVTRLATFDDEGKLKFWDIKNKKLIAQFNARANHVVALDGDKLLSRHKDQVTVYDFQDGKRISSLTAEGRGVRSGIISNDFRWIVYVCEDGMLRIWDSQSLGKYREAKPQGEWKEFEFASSTGDKEDLLLVRDHARQYWLDLKSGAVIRVYPERHAITNPIFSNDGSLFASEERMFDFRTGDEILRLYAFTPNDWLVTTPEGLFDGSHDGRNLVAYRIGDLANVLPVDRFYHSFAHPGLLSHVLGGKRPLPPADIQQLVDAMPPEIRLLYPGRSKHEVNASVINLEVRVKDLGGGIEGPFVRLNGQRMNVTTKRIERGDDGDVYRVTVPLVTAENRIRIEAACADGSWESDPESVTIINSQDRDKPKLYALCIGINKYSEASMALRFARPDATAMADALGDLTKGLFGQTEVVTLFDEEATSDNIHAAIRERIAKEISPQDVFILYAAAHGHTLGERYYLLPSEFQRKDRRFESDVREFGVSADTLGEWIRDITATKRIVILDTCSSGSALRDLGSRNAFGLASSVERLGRAEGVYMIAAAPASSDAREVNELGKGILTYSLLAALGATKRGPLAENTLFDQKQSIVSVDRWFSYASEHVPELYRQYLGSAQDIRTSVEGTPFPLFLKK